MQRCLGRAEAAFLLATFGMGIEVISIGAREAKNEFGAMKKYSVARNIADEYPRFEFVEPELDDNGNEIERNWYLIDSKTGGEVKHHISDAIVVAKVVANRVRLRERQSE